MTTARVATTLLLVLAVGSCGDSTTNDPAETTATSDGTAASNTAVTSASAGGASGTSTGSGTTTSSSTGATSGSTGGASGTTSGGAGGSTAGAGGASGAAGAGGSAAGAGGTSGQSLCPASPPPNGSECNEAWIDQTSFAGAHCSWGEDIRPECRTRGVCSGGTWILVEPDATRCADPPLPERCPAQPAESGSTCEMANLECWYDDGTRCVCSPCLGGSPYPVCGFIDPPQWACVTPDAACPYPLPNAGDICEEEQSCGLDCELPILCADGIWQWGQNGCPICAAPDTPIATPSGQRPIASLRVGDLVYSVDDEAIVLVPILRIGSTPVTRHQVVRVTLTDGSVLEISPGHPTADGRTFADLGAGSLLDESHRVRSAERVAYRHDRTYDILPATKSGSYFASGALIGSTLAGP